MVCPVCTIAIGAGVGLFRAWGIDDVITGLWIGALIISSIAWMIDYLNRKNIHFLFRKILVTVIFYALFIIPLYYMGIMGLPENKLFGFDKIGIGVVIGTIIFIIAMFSDLALKKLNEGKVVVYYQRVFIPLIYLLLASIDIHLLLKILG